MEIQLNIKEVLEFVIVLICLNFIVFLSVHSRSGSFDSPLLLDYDPHWHARHAEDILENNLKRPDWDLESFYPPGRPFPYQLGWEYTMILFHYILRLFSPMITFFKSMMYSNLIVAGMTAIVGFILGSKLTNKFGGLMTALFLVLSPSYIGVSQAGYVDSDGIVVFYITTVVMMTLNSLEMTRKNGLKDKKTILSIVLSSITMLLWTFYWQASWYIFILLMGLIPTYFGYLFLKENIFRKEDRIERPDTSDMTKERKRRIMEKYRRKKDKLPKRKMVIPIEHIRSMIFTMLIILVSVTLLNLITPTITIWDSLLESLGFVQKEMLVNVSVAELQPIGKILSLGGLKSIYNRIGMSFILGSLIIPLLIYKLFTRKEISLSVLFIGLWFVSGFYMLNWGWRFALLFSIPSSVAAGVVGGSLINESEDMEPIYSSIIIGMLLVSSYPSISYAFRAHESSTFDISNEWRWAFDYLENNSQATNNSLVMTWWDPGHIIAHETGLKVHSDGAHCSDDWCYPWGHNQRIQDMGRMMSTSNESEALELIRRYTNLTENQKETVKERFSYIPEEKAFEPVDKVFFISSKDLIYKFVWMNYFGGYSHEPQPISGTNLIKPGQCLAGNTGSWVWCLWTMQSAKQEGENIIYEYSGLKFTLLRQNDTYIPIYNNEYVIDYMTIVTREDGKPEYRILSFKDKVPNMKHIDGVMYVDTDKRNVIFIPGELKESIFVKTFLYNGMGLDKFHLLFFNDEVKIYQVEFDDKTELHPDLYRRLTEEEVEDILGEMEDNE